MMRYRSLLFLLRGVAAMIVAAAVLGATLAQAHKGATGIVKQRMDAMSALGDASKAVGKMIKGEHVFNADEIARHAGTINQHARGIVNQFPPDSLQPASEALPMIWQRWEEFVVLSQRLETASAALAEAAVAGDRGGVRAGFARVGKTCKSCHQDFRKKKQR